HAQERVGVSQASGGERVLGVEREGGAERFERVPDGDPPLVEEPTAFEVEVVGFEVFRVGPQQCPLATAGQAHLQPISDRAGDLLLDREHILGPAVEPLRPKIVAVRYVDELRGDPQLRSRLPHAALEHRADGELVPDDAQILVLALERKGGRPTDNPEPRQPREYVDDLFRNAVAEVLDLRVRAQVGTGARRDPFVVDKMRHALAAALAVPVLWASTLAYPLMGLKYCVAMVALDGIEHVVRRLTDPR